jgi:hypothetical protein
VSRTGKGPRYRLVFHPAVADDIATLAAYGPEAVAAARAALDDLAYGRVTGKALGSRRVSGDLTGLARVKFDVPGAGAQRFRLLYADIRVDSRAILAIGVRDEHAIYRMAVARIGAAEEGAGPGPTGLKEPS